MNRFFIINVSLLLLLSVFVSCGESSSMDSEPTAAPEATAAPEPVYDVTVIDALGREISFDSIPQKIASISPTATEMLYAAGGSAILRDRASNYPEEANALPDVGSAYDPSIETLVGARPDLVLIEALTQARFAPMLESMGLKVMAVKAETVSDVTTYISDLGSILESSDTASEKIEDIQTRLMALESSDSRSVLILISDQDRNLYAARPESYTGLIATTLGMSNKAEGLPDSGPYPGYALMSTEAILMANPDVIVTLTPAPEPAPRLSQTITQIPPFAALKAIQMNQVVEGDVVLFLRAPGPRIVDAVEFLQESLQSHNN